MRGTMMFLASWLTLAGLVSLIAYDSILPLVGFWIVLGILAKVAKALDG